MSRNISSLIEYLSTTAWAMDCGVLEKLALVVKRHVEGARLSHAEIADATSGQAERNAAGDRAAMTVDDGVAIVPITGVIARHSSLVNGSSQPTGTGIDTIRGMIREAVEAEDAETILLAIDSPGGSGTGLPDLADEIAAADAVKPVYAYTDSMAASAAYWLASGARRIWAARDAAVGSIGVYSVLVDDSRAAKNAGIDVQVVRTGPLKGAMIPGTAVGEQLIDHVRQQVAAMFADFQNAVSAGRGLDGDALAAVSDGRAFRGDDAVRLGLIDAVMTYDEAIAAVRGVPDGKTRPTRGDAMSKTTTKAADSLSGSEGQAATREAEQAGQDNTIRMEAVAAERKRIGEIAAALAGEDFADLRQQAVEAGWTPTEAKAAALDKATEALAAARQDTADLRATIARAGTDTAKLPSAVADEEAEDAAREAGQTAADTGKTRAAKYQGRVDELLKAGAKRSEAICRAGKELPDEHKAWVEENQ